MLVIVKCNACIVNQFSIGYPLFYNIGCLAGGQLMKEVMKNRRDCFKRVLQGEHLLTLNIVFKTVTNMIYILLLNSFLC